MEDETNPVIDCLMNHRSIRRFSDKPVEQDVLHTILSAGTPAATAGNLQRYTMLVIDDVKTRATLDAALELPFIRRSRCPHAIIALADQRRVRRWLQVHTDRTVYNHRLYNSFMAMWDALIALQITVVAAENLGLGTCYLGSGVELNIQELFGLPKDVFPAGLVAMGYPEHLPAVSQRLPLEAVVHHNRYQIPSTNDIHSWYHERGRVWDSVPDSRKQKLVEQDIHGIA